MTDLMDPTAPVYGAVSNHVGTIFVNRPDRKNALTEVMWHRIADLAEMFDEETGLRVIRLASAVPGCFAAGADIAEMKSAAESAELRERSRVAIRRGQRTLARVLKPSVAVIDGPCMGGGCGLALHCDFRLSSDRATFAITPAKLGLVYPRSDLKRLCDTVGMQGARKLLLRAQPVGAAEALAMGLVDEVTRHDALAGAADALCRRMTELSGHALRAVKAGLIAIEDGAVDDDEASAKAFNDAYVHPDGMEGLTAFLEKRPPQFGTRTDEG